jgi:uncharacterized protein (TIGR02145 family)
MPLNLKFEPMKRLLLVLGVLASSHLYFAVHAQTDPSKDFENCAYWELIEQLRAYEDTIAFEQSLPDTLRNEYGLPVTDNGVASKVYRIYRCAALLDSLANLQDSLDFVRAVPPTVDTDSISGITSSAATLHGRVLSDGGEPVTERWFGYGTSAASLNDTITATVGVPDSIFTAALSSLASGSWYVAAFAKNAKGTSSGDTLTFVIPVAPTMDSDSISGITSSTATFHGRTLSTGGAALSHRWFRYGTTAAALTDSIPGVAGTPDSLFTAAVTGLSPGTYYMAAFGKNVAGISSGDTLSFSTFQCGTSSVTYQTHPYTTVLIGTQCWFAENLRASSYKDGTAIPSGLDATAWSNSTTGALTTYGEGGGSAAANLTTYGHLYNWYAVTDPKGLCPAGWHVPDSTEWMTLFLHQGGLGVAGEKLKVTSSNTPPWDGTNTSGFSALDGGVRRPGGAFEYQLYLGGFWSTTGSGSNARYFYMTDGSTAVAPDVVTKKEGWSVRCLKD